MQGGLVLLTVFHSLIEARVAVSKLEAYGVFACAPFEFVSVNPHLMTAHGGAKVFVRSADFAIARDLLSDTVAAAVPPHPRRRWLEGLAGLVLLTHSVPPMPAPPDGRSQLRYAGPLAIALIVVHTLAMPEFLMGILLLLSR